MSPTGFLIATCVFLVGGAFLGAFRGFARYHSLPTYQRPMPHDERDFKFWYILRWASRGAWGGLIVLAAANGLAKTFDQNYAILWLNAELSFRYFGTVIWLIFSIFLGATKFRKYWPRYADSWPQQQAYLDDLITRRPNLQTFCTFVSLLSKPFYAIMSVISFVGLSFAVWWFPIEVWAIINRWLV